MSLELTSEERSRMWPVLERFFTSSIAFNAMMNVKIPEDIDFVPTFEGVWGDPKARAQAEDFMVELCEARYEKSPEQSEEELADATQLLEDMTEERDDLKGDKDNLIREIEGLENTVYDLEGDVYDKNDTIGELTDELHIAKETIATLEEEAQTLREGVQR